jgi:hypothetical protein
MHRQGYGWYPAHDEYRGRIHGHIRRVRPAFGVVMTEDYMPISEAWEAHPHAICARVWAIDDHNGDAGRALDADPRVAAEDLLQRYVDKIAQWRAQANMAERPFPDADHLYISAWNEPNQHTSYAKIAEGNKWLCRMATQAGVRVLAIKLGVGHPAELHADKSVNWSNFDDFELEEAINEGGHVVGFHAYFQAEGPDNGEDYAYLAGRHHGWPLDTPMVLDETGIDGGIFNRNPGWGWQAYGVSAAAYADMLRWTHDRLDPRVAAQCPYGLDFQNREWASFNYVDALDDIEQWVAQSAATAPPAEHTVHIPAIVVQPDPPQAAPEPETQPGGVLDPAVMMAILDVESGAAFGEGGRLVIRFEAHIFRDRLRNKFHGQLRSDVLFSAHFQIADSQPWAAPQYARENESSPWWAIHTGSQADEWRAFELAGRLDYRAAVESISMGRPQIMGFNHARVGYPTAEAMFAAFARRQDGEAAQIIAMLNYMLSDAELVRAIRQRDWREIARRYNGSGSVDTYSPLLEAAWRKRAAS